MNKDIKNYNIYDIFQQEWIIIDSIFSSKSDKKYLLFIQLWELSGHVIRIGMMTEDYSEFVILNLKFSLAGSPSPLVTDYPPEIISETNSPTSRFSRMHPGPINRLKYKDVLDMIMIHIINNSTI